MNTILRIEKVLDFYDVPQLFLARDKFEAQYICLLYEDSPVCKYAAIRISGKRINDFLSGKIDLRTIFEHPENSGEFYDVAFDEDAYQATALDIDNLPEDRLPEKGYTLDADSHETMTVNFPVKDHGLFTELIHKSGWACM